MWTGLERAPALTGWFSRVGMKFVDIGGRGGAFFPLLPLAAFSDYVVSEPDAAEGSRLAAELKSGAPWRSVTVMTEAIASTGPTAELKLTGQPGMSSLLDPDPAVAARFGLDAKFAVVGTATVPTIPLDDAARRYGFTDACFLKIDTQGTELDILQSGSTLVDSSILGVHAETNFHPFYRGQSLFADVDQFLRGRGFSLVSLSRTNMRRAGYRADLYSKRVTVWAHCLYLREPETLSGDVVTQGPALARLLALALAFQCFDLAFEIVERSRSLRLLSASDLDQLAVDVETVARVYMKRSLSKAERAAPDSLAERMLAPNARDRKRPEE